MSQPVWVLSVDLQAKTATFQSGMADAARSARSSFQQIGAAARESGDVVEESTIDVRHSLGALDNTIRGNHAAAMTDFIRLFQRSSVIMAALPFAAPIAGVLLLSGTIVEAIKKLHDMGEAQEKLRNDMMGLATAENNAWNGIDQRLNQAGQRADELRNDHMGALKLKLEEIDHQSMGELIKSLELVSKAADVVFKDLQGHWYSMGIGSAGASHALQQFQDQYTNLLSQGKDKDASDLLHGTLESAKQVLVLQQIAKDNSGSLLHTAGPNADIYTGMQAQLELKKSGVGYSEKEIAAQQAIVSALQAQVTSESKIAELKKLDQDNAKTQTGNEASARRAQAGKEAADSQTRIAQMAVSADKATADAQLEIAHGSIEARLKLDEDYAARKRDVALAGNQAEIAALDKSGKDYNNQLAALNDKALEIQQTYDTEVAELKAHSSVEAAQRDLTNLQQSEREKIDATEQGGAERLAAVNAAIKEEESLNLQQTSFYRELLQQRVQITRAMATDQSKVTAEIGKEEAENTAKMAQLALAAEKEKDALADSSKRASIARQIAEQTKYANEDFKIKDDALKAEIAALDKSGKDYANKLKELQDKETQLTKQHENEITAIQDRAAIDRNQTLLGAWQRYAGEISQGLTQVLMRHESFGKMMVQTGDQVVSGMIENALKAALAADIPKEKEAAAAARKLYLAGASFPFPINIVMAPALGAVGYAAAMAFAGGTDSVPGAGKGDTVPAMLTPGEGVVPGGVMDGLRKVARDGGFNSQGHTVHVHVNPTYHVNTIDGDGMQDVLDKHSEQLTEHFNKAVRRMNK